MKLYIAGGIVAVSVVVVISTMALVANRGGKPAQDQRPTTTVTSTTTETTEDLDTQSQITDENPPEQNTSSTKKSPNATYANYTEKAFVAAATHPRVLFFYDKADSTSTKVDALIRANLKTLPKNLHIFKVTYTPDNTLAEYFGITQPGVSLKIDTDGRLSSIYIPNGEPDPASFIESLELEAQKAE